ncbi:MAG: NAD-dependent epimerase/dehydratase family protein [Oscillatoriales cyanobacterium]|nr:MAG: NAD-dependent epimerase/dehydratase family protein [Oscillatoriales cyanobacterium]
MTTTLGVLGAGGFIGGRMVELLAADERFTTVAIGRSASKQLPLGAIARQADAQDGESLTQVLTDCQVAVYCLAGNPSFVRKNASRVYQAAVAAGVKRFVYLSSAVVHGQNPAVNTDERSPIRANHAIAYNNAKVKAERSLLAQRAGTKTEVVIVRPGIVWGPKSSWVAAFANAIADGVAYQADHGQGICNSVYVDNLVHGLILATITPGIDREAFVVGDAETVTWADLYRPIAQAMGADFDALPNVETATFRPSFKENLKETLRGMRGIGTLLSAIQERRQQARTTRPRPVLAPLNRELADLYRCQWHLPIAKAADQLAYQPPVSFADGCVKTVEWLNTSTPDALGHH